LILLSLRRLSILHQKKLATGPNDQKDYDHAQTNQHVACAWVHTLAGVAARPKEDNSWMIVYAQADF